MAPISQAAHLVNRSTYKLDTGGVAGLLGGDNAGDALETIHLYAGRRWVGWYNYPGAWTVAKRFGQMASSRLWDSLFPGPNESPAVTFNLSGKSGPEYRGSFSGTKLRTEYLGYLIAAECGNSPCEQMRLVSKGGTEGRKTGNSASMIVISLPPRQHRRITQSLTTTDVSTTMRNHEHILVDPKYDPPLALLAILPSLVSISACVFCFLGDDPLCGSLILLGIVSSGFSSLAFGSATLRIRVPVPSVNSPAGDGLMFPFGGDMIVLKGKEADVNVITKGKFELDYSDWVLVHQKYHTIGIASLLLMVQFLAQLLLIPRCTLFGQALFLASFIASGTYHLYVVSHEREKVHRELLIRELSAQIKKWTLGTRTQMAVFVCLVLRDGHEEPLMSKPEEVLSSVIPNETEVWKYWKKKVSKELEHFWKWNSKQGDVPYEPRIEAEPEDETENSEYLRLTVADKRLLDDLIADAWCVFNTYPEWQRSESAAWQERDDGAEENPKAHPLPGGSPA